MAEQPLILVTGATGTVGGEVVKQLVESGGKLRALVRNPAKAARLPSTIEVVQADLSQPDTLPQAFAGVEKAFIASNGLDIAALEGNAFEAAKQTGVKHIVKLSGRHLDADFMEGTSLARNQSASEMHLREFGVAWTILRPVMFASNFLLWLDRAQGAFFLPVGEGRDTPTDPRDIATAAVKTLTASGHEGKIYEITGPAYLTYPDMVRKIGNAIGQPLRLVDVGRDVALKGMLAAGVPATQAEGLLTYFDAVRAGKIYPPTTTLAELLGRPPRSFDEWVRDNVSAFRG